MTLSSQRNSSAPKPVITAASARLPRRLAERSPRAATSTQANVASNSLSGLLLAVGLFVRLRVAESPVFTQMAKAEQQARVPVIPALRRD